MYKKLLALLVGIVFCLAGTAACKQDENQVVSMGPLLCPTFAGPGFIVSTYVECKAKVGGTTVRPEGIKISIGNTLQVDVFPYVCPAYTAEQIESETEFDQEVQNELVLLYEDDDWEIIDIACDLSAE